MLRWGARPASSLSSAVKGSLMNHPRPAARIVTAAGSLGLAAVIGISAVAHGAVPVLSQSVNGDTAKVSVTGSSRTGVWRIRFVAPSGGKRLDLILRTGDVAWSGVVKVSRKDGNSWSIVGRRVLDGALAGGQQVGGCNAGVCWSTDDFRLPRNGDAKFGVTVKLTRAGAYRISGAVRQASEAFIYGPWISSGSFSVAH